MSVDGGGSVLSKNRGAGFDTNPTFCGGGDFETTLCGKIGISQVGIGLGGPCVHPKIPLRYLGFWRGVGEVQCHIIPSRWDVMKFLPTSRDAGA